MRLRSTTLGLVHLVAVLMLCGGPVWADQSQRLNRELHGLKGTDDRVEVAAREYPWRAMGRLNNGLGGHCSGVLVGPRLLATAAHCLWNPRTRAMIPVSSLTFVAGYDRGQYLKAAKVVRMHPSPAWDYATNGKNSPRSEDWALLELADPLGDEMGVVAIGDDPMAGQTITAAGYGKDKAHIPMAHMGCRVLKRQGTLVFNDCDAVQGDSGGPVLALQNGQMRVVALNVAVLLGGNQSSIALAASAFKTRAMQLGASSIGKPGTIGP